MPTTFLFNRYCFPFIISNQMRYSHLWQWIFSRVDGTYVNVYKAEISWLIKISGVSIASNEERGKQIGATVAHAPKYVITHPSPSLSFSVTHTLSFPLLSVTLMTSSVDLWKYLPSESVSGRTVKARHVRSLCNRFMNNQRDPYPLLTDVPGFLDLWFVTGHMSFGYTYTVIDSVLVHVLCHLE